MSLHTLSQDSMAPLACFCGPGFLGDVPNSFNLHGFGCTEYTVSHAGRSEEGPSSTALRTGDMTSDWQVSRLLLVKQMQVRSHVLHGNSGTQVVVIEHEHRSMCGDVLFHGREDRGTDTTFMLCCTSCSSAHDARLFVGCSSSFSRMPALPSSGTHENKKHVN